MSPSLGPNQNSVSLLGLTNFVEVGMVLDRLDQSLATSASYFGICHMASLYFDCVAFYRLKNTKTSEMLSATDDLSSLKHFMMHPPHTEATTQPQNIPLFIDHMRKIY